MKTIVAALSSSVGCKLLKFQNAEALQIGSSISERDCGELIEACTDVLVKLNENGEFILLFSFPLDINDSDVECNNVYEHR